MKFQQGNEFWKLAKNAGRPRKIKTIEELIEKIEGYFKYCVDNPLVASTYYDKNGVGHPEYKPRPFTKGGLALYSDYCSWEKFSALKEVDDDFSEIITRAENFIYEQKFSYSAIGVFNSNIIARDLGLTDKKEQKNDGEIKITLNRRIVE